MRKLHLGWLDVGDLGGQVHFFAASAFGYLVANIRKAVNIFSIRLHKVA